MEGVGRSSALLPGRAKQMHGIRGEKSGRRSAFCIQRLRASFWRGYPAAGAGEGVPGERKVR